MAVNLVVMLADHLVATMAALMVDDLAEKTVDVKEKQWAALTAALTDG